MEPEKTTETPTTEPETPPEPRMPQRYRQGDVLLTQVLVGDVVGEEKPLHPNYLLPQCVQIKEDGSPIGTPMGYELEETDVILAGEATGHNHRLKGGGIYKVKSKGGYSYNATEERYVRVGGDEDATVEFQEGNGDMELEQVGAVTHEEHATIELPPGWYKIERQSEYDGEEQARRVFD